MVDHPEAKEETLVLTRLFLSRNRIRRLLWTSKRKRVTKFWLEFRVIQVSEISETMHFRRNPR